VLYCAGAVRVLYSSLRVRGTLVRGSAPSLLCH